MNEETKPVSSALAGHPAEDELLLALEGELSIEEVTRVEQHLGNCWSCRARFDEMQRGILAFVEYREKRYLPSLVTLPDDSSDLRARLRNVAGGNYSSALWTRIWRKFVPFFVWPRQLRWVSAVAMVMAIVIFWGEVLINPRVVSANELLTLAMAAQNPPGGLGKSTQFPVARQKVKIQDGKQTLIRDFEWKIGTPIGQARWKLQSDPSAWNAPMTAEGFGEWRNSLRKKKDKVKRSGDLLTLDTTAGHGFIEEAWIVVRADDFHPIEQHLRFADERHLDFTELSFEISDKPRAPLDQHLEADAPQKASKVATARQAVDLDITELQLRYVLFMNQWDLGEDLVIGRNAGRVSLHGVASSKERGEAMRVSLSRLPHVRISIDLPSVSRTHIGRPNSAVASRGTEDSSKPLFRDRLEKEFPARDERLAFVDRCLAASDSALSHAWTLRKLAERYSEVEEQLLRPVSRKTLQTILRGHIQELARTNSSLESLVRLLPTSEAVASDTPSYWQAQILSLFKAAQHQDHLIATLLVGGQDRGESLSTASAKLRAAHQAMNKQLEAFRGAEGDYALK